MIHVNHGTDPVMGFTIKNLMGRTHCLLEPGEARFEVLGQRGSKFSSPTGSPLRGG